MTPIPDSTPFAALSLGSDPGWYAGWGTLALINAGLAQSKNRSGLAWFVVSLFLGPIATLFVVMSDYVEDDEE